MGYKEEGTLSGAASGAIAGSQILPGWGTVIGGAIGGIAGFFGSDNSAKKAAERARREAAAAEARWQGVFGATEKILADYYNSLDANDIKAQRVNVVQAEYQKANELVEQELAQRGMSDSGLSAELMAQGQYLNAMNKSTVTQGVEQEIADHQQSFLQLGYTQKQDPAKMAQNNYIRDVSATQIDNKATSANMTALGTIASKGVNAIYGSSTDSKSGGSGSAVKAPKLLDTKSNMYYNPVKGGYE